MFGVREIEIIAKLNPNSELEGNKMEKGIEIGSRTIRVSWVQHTKE